MNPGPRDYSAKRSFDQTPEPPSEVDGDVDPGSARPGNSFVIHQHHARRLHFDLRLEMFNGATPVLVSWAVPKNLPIEKGVRALAIHVEDHPFEYGSFSGSIPEGNYGAGEVRIFDSGRYELTEQAPGKLTFRLTGERMKGVWHLIRTGGKSGKDWLAMLRSWEAQPAEPVPGGPPMTAGTGSDAFDDPAWAFEPRLHGRRAWAVCGYRTTSMLSSDGEAIELPELKKLNERVVGLSAVLDGLIIGRPPDQGFVAVDLLYLDGKSVTDEPYSRRRELLEEALVPGGALSLSTSIPEEGTAVLKAALDLNLPGVIAKELASTYEPGPSDRWMDVPPTRPPQGSSSPRVR